MTNTSPLKIAVHRYLFEILKEKYQPHQDVIERIAHALVTDKDLREFSKLISDIYEIAYNRAFSDYQKQIEKTTGLKLAVSYGKSDKNQTIDG